MKEKEISECKQKFKKIKKENDKLNKIVDQYEEETKDWKEKFERIEAKLTNFVSEKSEMTATVENENLHLE